MQDGTFSLKYRTTSALAHLHGPRWRQVLAEKMKSLRESVASMSDTLDVAEIVPLLSTDREPDHAREEQVSEHGEPVRAQGGEPVMAQGGEPVRAQGGEPVSGQVAPREVQTNVTELNIMEASVAQAKSAELDTEGNNTEELNGTQRVPHEMKAATFNDLKVKGNDLFAKVSHYFLLFFISPIHSTPPS